MMDSLRLQISKRDDELLSVLTRRFSWVCDMAHYKREHGLPFRNLEQEELVINRIIAQNPKLRPEFIRQIYQLIFTENDLYFGYQNETIKFI